MEASRLESFNMGQYDSILIPKLPNQFRQKILVHFLSASRKELRLDLDRCLELWNHAD
jgi:hypothetical protein